MNCLNCNNKELTTQALDSELMKAKRDLHIHCSDCDTVFIIYMNSAGNLAIKCRDS